MARARALTAKTALVLESLAEAYRLPSLWPASIKINRPSEAWRGAVALIRWLVDLAKTRRTGVWSWVLAGGFLAAAVAVRLALAEWLDPAPFLAFFPAVAASTLFCGWRQGALVLVLSAIAAWHLFPEQNFSFPIGVDPALEIARFLLVAALLIMLVEGLIQVVVELDHTARVNEDLFRELQHRVANNLQIIAATLQKAQRGIQDPVAAQAINVALGRIHSLAGLHRRLYDAAAYSQGLEPILRDVLAETFRALPVDIRLDVRCGDLSVGQMTAIALLVNEAAINAAKHVFRPGKGSLFEVSLAEVERGRVQLTIRDDGPGIPTEAAASPQMQRLGLTVMRGLAGQLGGSLEVFDSPGATLKLKFPRARPSGPAMS
jgi:two-component system, sensor histidine kinase PdtaS